MFGKLKTGLRNAQTNRAAGRLAEEELYLQVVDEISNGIIRDGLWGKAKVESAGNDEAAKALYIKYRVQAIKDEATVASAIAEQKAELARQKQKEELEREVLNEQQSREAQRQAAQASNEAGKRDGVGFVILILLFVLIPTIAALLG